MFRKSKYEMLQISGEDWTESVVCQSWANKNNASPKQAKRNKDRGPKYLGRRIDEAKSYVRRSLYTGYQKAREEDMSCVEGALNGSEQAPCSLLRCQKSLEI